MTENSNSTVFSHAYIPMICFNLYVRYSKISMIRNNKIKEKEKLVQVRLFCG